MKIDILRKNIGGNDRKFRLIGGVFLTSIGLLSKQNLITLGGSIILFTGLTQKCIFYDMLNIDTYNKEKDFT